ncbi:putative serine protease PepD [Nonomuraea maritima]|uniref:Putative serine protease PepD n=1 Tax=Nonomuraea maritima TaxID=683260 RepID=A0A1G9QZ26_9ACTN|nr:trypsin-like peptidase domain-containing protein [Nonomuraea maritima]SDM15837.1 putative serine protease PepD [Nonomuraea maritima]
MTDERRPDEGRTSDNPEPQGRPDFLPADDRSDPPASFGAAWGDPSGRPETAGTAPYEGRRPYEGHEAPQQGDGPQQGAPAFGSPDSGPRPYDGPPFAGPDSTGTRAYDNPFGTPDNGPRQFEGQSYGPDSGPRQFEGQSYGPDSGPRQFEGQQYGPEGGSRSFEGQSYGAEGGAPSFENPSYGGPESGTWAYERPPFGQPGYGGPPPPPRQALGMGPGWGPPPQGGPHGGPHGGPYGVGAARRGPSTGLMIVTALVIALVASLLGSVGTYLLTRNTTTANDPSYSLGPLPTGATERAPDSVAGVAARVLPSVVSLEVGNGGAEGASGSGFLIKNGYVVTNNHVVALAANGGDIKIMFNNRKTTTGRIVGRDPGSDLAVVKPDETFGSPEITLGNSDKVVVGDPVIAIGSPLGLTGTVTTGIVSSLNRPVIAGDESGTGSEEPAYISAIQTDAAINPGNSGGPLVNGRGEVVGVNSAIATLGRSMSNQQSGSIGLGFAIPVNQTRRVAEELITTGRAKRPKIGIILDRNFQGQGVKISTESLGGQQPVTPGGPADKAGLKAGDVILEIDGLRLQDGNELIALIRSKEPGSKIAVKYQRDNQERTATLTVVAEDEATPTPTRS